MTRNLDGVSMELIYDKAILRVNIYLFAIKYLKKTAFCFGEITKDNEEINEMWKRERQFLIQKKR